MRYTKFIVRLFFFKEIHKVTNCTYFKHDNTQPQTRQDKTECCFHRLFSMEGWHVYICIMAEICTFSKNSRANLKNPDARRVTSSKFHSKDPHTSCAWQIGIHKSLEYGCKLSKSECVVFISGDPLQTVSQCVLRLHRQKSRILF